MKAAQIIRNKRDGLGNSPEEIQALVAGAVQGTIPRYQVAAWLMAVYFQGLSPWELRSLTQSLIQSGSIVEFGDIPGYKVDKHSTGGVGDKTSPILAPIVAAAGAYVPMISGRGLGHTGGTLDKLESVPGFRVDLKLEDFQRLVRDFGFGLIGQTSELVPGDRILYGLRDVTCTVESIPLIVASIISKKVAEGIDGLVLDVKTGSGAFMKTFEDSEKLALLLVEMGRSLGKETVALITDMSQPLGRMVGNSLEMIECFDTLKGKGPEDLTSLSIELSAHMLHLAGRAGTLQAARELAREQIDSGAALRKLGDLLQAQGGDRRVLEDYGLMPGVDSVFEYTSAESGYLLSAQADRIGRAAMLLGAGRQAADSKINLAVGIELKKKVGDRVEAGEALARIHHVDEASLDQALQELTSAFEIGPGRVEPPQLVRKVIG